VTTSGRHLAKKLAARRVFGTPGLTEDMKRLTHVLLEEGRGMYPTELLAQLVHRYAAIGVSPSELRRRLRQGEGVLDIAQLTGR
jgi:hypothetical protein